jgi:hypothetical protein
VRFWWGSGIVLAGIGIYLSALQYYSWNKDRRLIEEGIPVKATILTANAVPDRYKSQPPDSVVELVYTHNGVEYEQKGFLAGREEWIEIGSQIDLRLDPNDPNVWTARLVPAPLARQLIGPMVTIPAIAIVLAMAWLMHRRTRGIYENGDVILSEVVDLRTSPIAPMSRAVVCTPMAEDDKRLFTVYIPQRLIRLEKGDDVNLLVHRNRAVAVMRYE